MVATSICSLVFLCHSHCYVSISVNDQACNSLHEFLSLNTCQGLLYILTSLTKVDNLPAFLFKQHWLISKTKPQLLSIFLSKALDIVVRSQQLLYPQHCWEFPGSPHRCLRPQRWVFFSGRLKDEFPIGHPCALRTWSKTLQGMVKP